MNGPEITRSILLYLQALGWLALTFNSNRPMPSGAKGLPDILAIGPNHVLFCEVKAGGDRMRPEQVAFAETMDEFTGPNVGYLVAHSLDDVIDFMEREWKQ